MPDYLLSIDQGTTSTRALVFDAKLQVKASAQKEFKQFFPASGWVEHDADEIWASVLSTCKSVIKKFKAASIKAIGITNQRETVVMWDRKTGKPLHKAIVWQDRRTAEFCERLKAAGHEKMVSAKTGLLLDPYFSGTKLAWLLDNVKGARARAEAGELCFGTIDSFLIWRLTSGKVHATDATNASRTLLFNIHTGKWDAELLALLKIPRGILPEVKNCADDFGKTDKKLFGAEIKIGGVAGDQHAALIGQACFTPGMVKSTYGTGCFAMLNTGAEAVPSHNRLLTTIAYQLDGEKTYALEGSIFIAGAAVQWLRDGLQLIKSAGETGALAQAADPAQQVYLVPAFVGLGAPYWKPDIRGAIFGLTRGTTKKEMAKAALESVCFQTFDLLDAMKKDWPGLQNTVLRVDGGMTASDWTMQALADILGAPVDRPRVLETTALGAAYLAGLSAGLVPKPSSFAKQWKSDRRFKAKMKPAMRDAKIRGWQICIKSLLSAEA
ncbi:glycerol kinase GlpK [Aestuariivirga litoralis]|uniref:glycerol kinase GlpK n=1 Tax=Aestuariivirga litoralis TaxID=2650924 RepID=UPI0018C6354E|nr:glycerol kinase GlpK [Aestuariivirga litoralis]MBG1232593.1 glycerol kinase GlpK [Aestuariivirga litoralis]